jgi:alpha-glucosidase
MEVPKTFPAMDVRHDYDGNPSHRKAHNIYGTQMARATYLVSRICIPKQPL